MTAKPELGTIECVETAAVPSENHDCDIWSIYEFGQGSLQQIDSIFPEESKCVKYTSKMAIKEELRNAHRRCVYLLRAFPSMMSDGRLAIVYKL